LTKTVPETRAERGDDEHLGYDTHEQTWSKTMLIEATGHVPIDAPRDRAGTFIPQTVKNRQRRLSGSTGPCCHCLGVVSGEISAHFAEMYGASVSRRPFPGCGCHT
jgi:putative transposase